MSGRESRRHARQSTVRILTVHGTSMVPLVLPGDRIAVDGGVVPRPGDVVAVSARDGSRRRLHRVTAIDPVLVTQGDNRATPDVPMRGEHVLGVARAIQQGGSGPWKSINARAGAGILRVVRLLPHGRVRRAILRPFAARWIGSACPQPPTGTRPTGPPREPARPSFEVQQVGADTVVLEPRTGDVHVLNGIAAGIWRLRNDGYDRDAVLDRLVAAYPAVGRARLASDLDNVWSDLDDLTAPGAR